MTAVGEGLLTYKGTVYPWHCDEMGHMNVMWYVGKFDEGTRHFFHALGLTPQFLRVNKRGMAAVAQTIQYQRELLAGDIVTVHSVLLEIREKVVRFAHEMRKADTGEVAATTTLTAVHLDTVARRACAFPESVRAKGATLLAQVDSLDTAPLREAGS
ncbi:MAG: thioesterase family protein [Xanthobacteraceae bacterium]